MSSRRDLVGALSALLRLINKVTTVQDITRTRTYSHAVDVSMRADRGLIDQLPWTPFEPVARQPLNEATIATIMQRAGCGRDEAIARFEAAMGGAMYANSRYQVIVQEHGIDGVHLSIKRIDQLPIHDWRDLQQIKDELIGEECEAVELYPAKSRVLDAANQYHLWATRDTSYRFPVGFEHGGVEGVESAAAIGAVQRQHRG